MLYAVTHEKQADYEPRLEQSYRVRHKVFVDGLGWDELRRDDQREIDQFDTDGTIHLLSKRFLHLTTNQNIPRALDIYEWTRFYVGPAARDYARSCGVSQQVMCGMQKYCLSTDIKGLSAVEEPCWLPRLPRFGWRPQPLGLPQEHDAETNVIGLRMEVSQAVLGRTRKGHPFPNRIVFL